MLKFFRELLHHFRVEWWRFCQENFLIRDPHVELENQLRLMFARGEITKESYKQLRLRLDHNQISRGDLTLIHQEAVRRLEAKGKLFPGSRNPEIERGLDTLYLDRVLIDEARSEVEARRQALSGEIAWIKEQGEAARENAQSALPDENAARTYLEIWQELMEVSTDLEARMRDILQTGEAMKALEAELRASITRLKLLDSQQHMAELNLRIKQDLLLQEQKQI